MHVNPVVAVALPIYINTPNCQHWWGHHVIGAVFQDLTYNAPRGTAKIAGLLRMVANMLDGPTRRNYMPFSHARLCNLWVNLQWRWAHKSD
jgi:hypothetical protein